MNNEYTPSHSPDSLDLENPTDTTSIIVRSDQIDDFYENEMNTKLDEIKNNFIDNLPNYNNELNYHYLDSNSPLTISCDNSDIDDNDHYREATFDEIKDSLEKYFIDDDSRAQISNELDILITYMKGQKNLFIESYLLCQKKLHLLMVPCILITASIAVIAPLYQDEPWCIGFISGLNACVAMFIALINYLKLETSTQTFSTSAIQYDKLEISLEFLSSKLIFMNNEKEKKKCIFDKFQEAETTINDIKEWNSLFIPREIRRIFPIICHINIFSFIKRIENNKKILISRFKDVKNEIKYILHRGNQKHNKSRIQSRMKCLIAQKEKIKEELMHYRNAYSYIDEIFTIEIKNAQKYSFFQHYNPFNSITFDKSNNVNPIVDKYILLSYNSTLNNRQ